MPDAITAREAIHHFSRVLRDVEAGREFVVTRNGVPVARIIPEHPTDGSRRLTPAQDQTLAASIASLRRGWPLGIQRLGRDELYDDARKR